MRSFYYGWVVVGIVFFMLMLSTGTTVSAFGFFVLPVSEEFGLSRADTNTAIIILNLGASICAPFLGRALDLLSPRHIMAGSAILFGVGMATLGLSHSVWLSALVLALPLAIAVLGVGMSTATVLVTRWFAIQRGRAVAIAIMGSSLGGMVVAPMVGVMVESLGWRPTLIAIGCVLGATILVLSFFIRSAPREDEHEIAPDKAASMPAAAKAAAELGAPLKATQILRMPQFWLIAVGGALSVGMGQSILVSMVPLSHFRGLGTGETATIVSAFGGAAIIGKLLLAWIGDRFDRANMLVAVFLGQALLNVALIFAQSFAPLVVVSLGLGLCMGVGMPIMLSLLADRFGAASIGTASGLSMLFFAVLGASAIRFAGEVFDRTGGYDLLFVTYIFGHVFSAAMLFYSAYAHRRAVAQPAT